MVEGAAGPINSFEQQRLENIARKNAFLAQLGLGPIGGAAPFPPPQPAQPRGQRKQPKQQQQQQQAPQSRVATRASASATRAAMEPQPGVAAMLDACLTVAGPEFWPAGGAEAAALKLVDEGYTPAEVAQQRIKRDDMQAACGAAVAARLCWRDATPDGAPPPLQAAGKTKPSAAGKPPQVAATRNIINAHLADWADPHIAAGKTWGKIPMEERMEAANRAAIGQNADNAFKKDDRQHKANRHALEHVWVDTEVFSIFNAYFNNTKSADKRLKAAKRVEERAQRTESARQMAEAAASAKDAARLRDGGSASDAEGASAAEAPAPTAPPQPGLAAEPLPPAVEPSPQQPQQQAQMTKDIREPPSALEQQVAQLVAMVARQREELQAVREEQRDKEQPPRGGRPSTRKRAAAAPAPAPAPAVAATRKRRHEQSAR